ncbi:pyridoxal-dependent decarboxylase, exosortase A system-associated [Pseudoduganella albidiflava]|uniref:Pyridoxal-dependent decarboxylase, exosortase A system-associated n=1 Tax=Pseudoduganella albidiflava TaxID=321983 RepID=A0A411X5B9_9BURK|nr:pyridoxal-dependent decarboxylase, exosortase A system-associated [Pseudoduganella albidiflava]QBI04216.1 pyridoxal-dependent decarboxylase, exosortase A system-associated [Pseudoduganella albidiflava]GGY25538.1 pyridoxal-dependent decarboxylase, exosortase A system-associated [Pseudoduganella albidiflava]
MSAPRPQHAPLLQFPVVDDCLHIGGMPLTRLAQRVGQTPFYAYDRGALTARVAELRRHLPADVHLHYAMKANPMPAVVQHMAALVDGIDVASGGELRVALDTPMNPVHISFAGPGKSDLDLSCAIAAGIVLNLESEGETERAARIGDHLGITPRVNVRVNPDFELKSSGMKMGGGPKQFGVDAERVPALLRRIGELGLDFHGFHIFSGSQNLKAAALHEAHEKTFALALRLAQDAPRAPRILNIGGGFGIPYFPGEDRLDLAAVGSNLHAVMDEVRPQLRGAQVVIELGRYLVGEAGVYVCRIVDRKESRGSVYLVTDGGLHHHLSASGNFGQVIRKNYPVVIGNRVHGGEREKASVVGPLCTPLDVLADGMDLARAQPGDLVAVLQSGAYGVSASPAGFLSHPAAPEILV